jgi:hypothetical protein
VPGCFEALGIPVQAGHDFAWSDLEHDAPRVAVVSASLLLRSSDSEVRGGSCCLKNGFPIRETLGEYFPGSET